MKRMVICADGTWNVRDQLNKKTGKRRPTNVTKVARAVEPSARDGTAQVVFYDEGVGTSGGLDKYTGGAFGDGIEKNIRELYRAIVYNYSPGDELFLFGFSRGAFTVRSLAGFMQLVGLIDKDDDYWLPELYGCYERGHRPGSREWEKVSRHFERDRMPSPPILFIGVWDTVGALGAPGILGQLLRKKRYTYHDVSLTASISHAYHALAIDERRKPFAPSVWDRPPGWAGELEQAWFPGVHCNVGGGESPDGLANEALHWMVEKAERLGLEVDSQYLGHFRNCFNSELDDSMTPFYRVLGEHVRPIGVHGPDERLHRATVDRHALSACAYAPQNLGDYLGRKPGAPIYQTTRVPCGTPCPPSPSP